MNKVVLMGRLARDPELRYTTSNTANCRLTIAVDRRFKTEGQPTADFITVVAWRQTAEFIGKYFVKGSRIIISGSIQTRTWDDKEGKRHYDTEVVADEAEFCESKKSDSQGITTAHTASFNNDNSAEQNTNPAPADGFYPLDDDGDIPF